VPYVLGLSQGVFRLVRAADAGAWMVASPVTLAATVGSVPLVRGDGSRRPVPLTDFEQRVHVLAGGGK
jgi:hypothetical protein